VFRRARFRIEGGANLRFVYIALIVVATAIVALFKFQNLEMVTVSLWTARFTLPVSVLIFLVYVLGMLTGSSLLALLRTWVTRARHRHR
jgi:uncharacterized integral membrane protein